MLLVMGGILGLSFYANTPSVERLVGTVWNEDLLGTKGEGKTLVYFIHPNCPCTLASNFELQRVLQQNYPELNIVSVIRSENRSIESPINGRTIYDTNGEISSELGINTSGHVVLYDKNGLAIYSGGVTPSRGHRGNNFGSSSLINLLADTTTSSNNTQNLISFFTYGCKLNKHES